jgi:peptidoglycan/LPS O-acetylase OafA/YrhL
MKTDRPDQIAFIHLLRGVAPLIVLWAHLGGWWLYVAGRTSGLQTGWTDLVCRPFHLYQDGGHLGVLLFFLVSGFVITHVSLRENRGEFLVRRVFRLMPTLIVAVACLPPLAWACAKLDLPAPMGTESTSYFSGILLLNYFTGGPQVLTVLWTLFIEVLFYALTFGLIAFSKRRPIAATWLMLAVPHLLNVAAIALSSLRMAMWGVMYLPFLLIGRCIYLGWSHKEDFHQALLVGLVSYGSFLLIYENISPGRLFLPGGGPAISHLYAVGIFLALCASGLRKIPAVLSFAAEISYSLYLLHAPLGGTLLFLLTKHGIPYEMALPIAILVVVGTSYLVFRTVELPAQGLGRRICLRLRGSE